MAVADQGEIMAAARSNGGWRRRTSRRSLAVEVRMTARRLSAGEERTLAERIKAGDVDAGQQLITANLGLVLHAVSDYKQCGVPLDDLIQEGNLGLIRAARHFDPATHTARFATYATYWIRCFIVRALASNGSLIQRPEKCASAAPAISQGGRRASCSGSRHKRRARLDIAQSRRGCPIPRGPAAPARAGATHPERARHLPEPGRSDAG